jgi:hypothetical protein
MIKFESGMLVLDSTATKQDIDAINEFADYHRKREREEILGKLQETLEGYQTVKDFDYFWTMREIIDIVNDEYTMRRPTVDFKDLVELRKTKFNPDELLVD